METKGKVLIVENRGEKAAMLKNALLKKAYWAITAENAAEGMKKAEKECPDIFILDAKLQKDGDAVEACRSYRKEDSKFRHVPILMMIDREDYAANSLFENPRWSPFESLDGKPDSVKSMIDDVEEIVNKTLKDTFVILFGYYKEDKDEAAQNAKHAAHASKKSA